MKLALLAILACLARAAVPCVIVDRSSVTAGDLSATISGFQEIAANRHLVWAPAPGLTRWLSATELRAIAAREGLTIQVGGGVCLQRQTVVFTEQQVVGALRERLPPLSEIRVVDYCRLPMMSGQLRFEARPAMLSTGENRWLHWKGMVIGDDRRSAPFWASVEVQIKRRVVRAARLIPAKTILSKEDLTEEVEQSSVVDFDPPPDLASLLGKECIRQIDARKVINRSWLRTPPLINRGQIVRVTVESGQARLGLDARALNSGNMGDTLLFMNGEGGRKFRAKVTGPGMAMVPMEVQSK
jgi:flagella basal body P-ring formation protein FlgA